MSTFVPASLHEAQLSPGLPLARLPDELDLRVDRAQMTELLCDRRAQSLGDLRLLQLAQLHADRLSAELLGGRLESGDLLEGLETMLQRGQVLFERPPRLQLAELAQDVALLIDVPQRCLHVR